MTLLPTRPLPWSEEVALRDLLDDTAHLSVVEHGGTWVVTVVGSADVRCAPRLRQRLGALVGGGAQRVVLDLDRATVDSGFVRVLVDLARRVRAAGAQLAVASTRPGLLQAVGLTRLGQLVDVYPSATAALAGSHSAA